MPLSQVANLSLRALPAALLLQAGRKQIEVGVDDLFRSRSLAEINQLVAGGEQRHLRSAKDPDPGHAGGGGEQADLSRPQGAARLQEHLALAEFLAAKAHMVAPVHRLLQPDAPILLHHLLERSDRVAAGISQQAATSSARARPNASGKGISSVFSGPRVRRIVSRASS